MHANLPGELEVWQANEKQWTPNWRAKLEFNTWFATNRVTGRILFSDGFNPPSLWARMVKHRARR